MATATCVACPRASFFAMRGAICPETASVFRSLIMHRSNVTGLVDRLEARGLVQRRDSAHDRRAYRVVLTTAGKRLVQQILPRYYAAAEQVWGALPVARTHQLVSELTRVCANAEKVAADGLAN